jgi:hypothetical protein
MLIQVDKRIIGEQFRGDTAVRDRWAGTDYGIVCWWGHGSSTSAAV